MEIVSDEPEAPSAPRSRRRILETGDEPTPPAEAEMDRYVSGMHSLAALLAAAAGFSAVGVILLTVRGHIPYALVLSVVDVLPLTVLAVLAGFRQTWINYVVVGLAILGIAYTLLLVLSVVEAGSEALSSGASFLAVIRWLFLGSALLLSFRNIARYRVLSSLGLDRERHRQLAADAPSLSIPRLAVGAIVVAVFGWGFHHFTVLRVVSNLSAGRNGGSYTGLVDWRGRPHGGGHQTNSDGSSYAGSWRGGKRHGQGTLHDSLAGWYQGEWRDDLRDGQGEQRFADGKEYHGEWRIGKRHGEGVQTYRDGLELRIRWKEDRPTGEGSCRLPDGSEFVVRYDPKTGHLLANAEVSYPSGGGFAGEFFLDPKTGVPVPHGIGKARYADGSSFEGTWKKGKVVGSGTFELAGGTVYDGKVRHSSARGSSPEPRLVETPARLRKIPARSRPFEKPLLVPNGRGRATLPDGTVCSGTWRDGILHGSGRVERPNGEVENVVWHLGHFKTGSNPIWPDLRVDSRSRTTALVR